MFRKIIHPLTSKDLVITLPEKYISKEVEVIAFEVNDREEKPEMSKEDKTRQTLDFLDNLPRVNMSGFKFNRDEANER